ncbi:DUF6985 domain-containing protein [Chondrinema litorale]|uniref:DUF6985 domain-containing protein n=1 Tax=Chondrinema litorale TaxID=2994555 RepID=UPI00254319D5|nr:hypothetical protein [Chondrinema litorale]UZR96096.1 hypothetical protein OQ292_09785 [Chondrinema litorale]
MPQFNFDSYNHVIVEMPVLAQQDKDGNEHFFSFFEANRNNGLVNIGFFGEVNCWEHEQHYSNEQLAAWSFVEDHQAEILAALFDYTKNILYPTHLEYIGYDEVSFPEINSVDDLRKALGVNLISFFYEHKEGVSYCGLDCSFSGDYEHGVQIVMHKTNILGWQENLGKELVFADLNI